MKAQELLLLVQDFAQWKGDVYRLAVIVAEKQRMEDADKVEAAGYTDLAEEIRRES